MEQLLTTLPYLFANEHDYYNDYEIAYKPAQNSFEAEEFAKLELLNRNIDHDEVVNNSISMHLMMVWTPWFYTGSSKMKWKMK